MMGAATVLPFYVLGNITAALVAEIFDFQPMASL
jgi:hypothetical protein